MKFEQKNKNSIKCLFNGIAKNYDRINIYMSFGLQKLIKIIAVKRTLKKYKTKPLNILDLCTGTGDIAILFKKYSQNSSVYGIDFSEKMLEIAKQRTNEITFIQDDILNQNEDLKGKFDICFIGFGLRNLPDIDEFLENVKFYLKNDGVLSILDLGRPNFFMKPYFYLHYKLIIPLFAFLFNRDVKPYQYFVNSAKTYPKQQDLLKKLKEHGYKQAENYNYSFGIISQQLAVK